MKKIIHHTKRLFDKIQKIQQEMKQNTDIEKFALPDTDTTDDKKKVKEIQVIEIAPKSVAKATLTIIGILLLTYFLYELRTLLILFFISLFFSATLDPLVDWLEKKRIPRAVGVVLIFLCLLGIIIAIIGSVVPTIITQITSLVTNFANWVIHFFDSIQTGKGLEFVPEPYRTWLINTFTSINLETILAQVVDNISTITSQIKDIASGSLKTIGSTVGAGVSVTVSVASWAFNFILVLFLTFFMVVDKSSLGDFFHALFPKRYGTYISEKTGAIQKQIGAWMRGQLLLSLIMFICTFISLLFIGMKEYALTLALTMAISEFIPYIGPVIFLSFSLPIAFGISFGVVIKLIIFYGIIQFLEGNIFVPAVMNKVVGLSPIVILLVLIIGFKFLGVIGAIVAVPVTTAAAIFLSDYMKSMANKK